MYYGHEMLSKKVNTPKNIFFFLLLTIMFVKKKQSFYNIRPTIHFSNKLGKYSPCTSRFSEAFSSSSYRQANVSEGIQLVCFLTKEFSFSNFTGLFIRFQLQRLTCSKTYSGKCKLQTCKPSSLHGILGYSSSFHLFSSGSKVRIESL